MPLRYLAIYVLLILYVGPISGLSQDFGFRNYSVADGLAQSQVFAMHGDQQGHLWLGTRGGGLSCFDGKDFRNFSTRQGLSSNYLWTVYVGSRSRVWIGSDQGLDLWNGRNFQNFELNADKKPTVLALTEDSTGRLWIGTNHGLFFWEEGKITDLSQNPNYPPEEISCLYTDPLGQVWVGQAGRITLLSKGQIRRFGPSNGLPRGKSIRDMVLGENGRLWIGTYGAGLYYLENNQIQPHITQSQLGETYLFDLHIDQHGKLWMASLRQGVFVWKSQDRSLIQYTESDGLAANYVRTIWEDPWGNLWFGTSGGGMSKYFGQAFTHYDRKNGLPAKAVYSVLEDRKGRIWMGVGGQGLARMFEDSLILYNAQTSNFPDRKVKCLFEDQGGQIWLGTEGAGLGHFQDSTFHFYTREDGLSGNWIRDIVQDSSGHLWIATAGEGINRMEIREDGSFTIKVFNRENGLPDNRISCLHVDKRNRLWFATRQAGVGYISERGEIHSLKGKTYPFVRSLVEDLYGYLWYGTAGAGLGNLQLYAHPDTFPIQNFEAGLASSNVYLLGLDTAQNVWIGTEKGLDRATLDPDRKIIDLKHFGASEGFVGIETCQNAVICDQNGSMWFGTINGLTQYKPIQTQQRQEPPRLEITNIRLTYAPIEKTQYAHQMVHWDQEGVVLSFPYWDNHLGFDFNAVDHSNPEGISYEWWLQGLEDDWSPPSANTRTTYANIPPGHYQFWVRATNPEGLRSVARKVVFEIKPPFWQNFWIQLIGGLILTALIAFIFRYRIDQIKRKASAERQRLEMEKDLLKLEQKALSLQINPHFMFNALNSIQALIAKKDAKSARYYLAKFARLMRLVLESSRETMIPLSQEIATLEIYLAIEQFSRGGHFDFSVVVGEEIDEEEIMIPPLLLQPFVENAIIHGVAHKTTQGNILISFQVEEDYIICSIKDDGLGRVKARELKSQQKQRNKSLGLQVTQERLAILHAESGQEVQQSISFIDLMDEEGAPAGTEVIVRLPILNV